VVDESVLHATATGEVFGLNGRGRPVRVGLLHVFDFEDGLICWERARLDLASLRRQLLPPDT
jgi:predicted ester cyclase